MELLLFVLLFAAVLAALLVTAGLFVMGRQFTRSLAAIAWDPRLRVGWQRRTAIRKLGNGGAAKVEGVVTPAGAPLVSPLRKRSCVAWRVCGRRALDDSEYEASDSCDFVIEDDSGSALVPRDHLELVMAPADVVSRQRASIIAGDLLFDERVLAVGHERSCTARRCWLPTRRAAATGWTTARPRDDRCSMPVRASRCGRSRRSDARE